MPTMETRFRNFINTRRTRSFEDEISQTDISSQPQHLSPLPTQTSTFPFKSRARHQPDTYQSNLNAMPLRSFSYESCQAGKTPTFGALPQKGNGPIKLQTSRRLSSGELVVLPQDSQRTLEDIREDGYVVGKSNKQTSPVQKPTTSLQSEHRPHLNHASYSAPSLQAPFSPHVWSQSMKISNEDLQSARTESSWTAHQPVGLGVFEAISPARTSRTYDAASDYRASSRNNSVSAESCRSSARQLQDSNSTLKALRRAEYTKLVELYGSDTAARNLAYYNACHASAMSNPTSPSLPIFSPVILEPLPLPPTEAENPRLSQSSSTSESLYSGSSSPQRTSYVSSIATGQTSIEEESMSTREDIRKMVEQMRNSYLSAIECHDPTPAKTKPRRPRRNKHASTAPKVAMSGLSGPSTQGRQTWHPADVERDTRSQRRINSHPPSGFGRLSPIEASPPRNTQKEFGLRRADSGTLGSLTAEVTRAEIRSRSVTSHDYNTSPELAQQRYASATKSPNTGSWLEIDTDQPVAGETASPTALESPPTVRMDLVAQEEVPNAHSRQVSEDLDALFSDDLWTSTSSAPSLRPLSVFKTDSDNPPPATPKRGTMQITSIPESPEYTHLATTDDPDDNFI